MRSEWPGKRPLKLASFRALADDPVETDDGKRPVAGHLVGPVQAAKPATTVIGGPIGLAGLGSVSWGDGPWLF